MGWQFLSLSQTQDIDIYKIGIIPVQTILNEFEG